MDHDVEDDFGHEPAHVDDVETEFWSRVPDSRFARRRSPKADRDVARQQRANGARPAGSRSHHDDIGPVAVPRPITSSITQSIPVVTEALSGGVRQATRHVDPLIRRLGVAAIVTALAVPVALSLRGDDPSAVTTLDVAAAAGTDAASAAAPGTDAGTTVEVAAESASPWASIDVNALPEAVPVNTEAAAPVTEAAPAAKSATSAASAATAGGAAVANAPAKRAQSAVTQSTCGSKYTVRSGDAWLLIASRAKVTLRALLDANKATTSTPLYPGRTICLPPGAVMPAASSSSGSSTSPTTTAPKPTTTTAAPAPTVSYSRAQIEKIIRDVWPDNLEDHALAIAIRESNLNPNVHNYCCYGLFQIYYSVHKTWLANLGITSASKLYDPKLNAFAAYVLYLRSGSFAPWGG